MSKLRLPRLTLFSGSNCSLCDTAKAELAKVRHSRDFQLDVINIQDPGQEKWKRKYVYWIPALHLEDTEIAKGRWDASIVFQALENDVLPSHYSTWAQSGTYTPYTNDILGERDVATPSLNKSRCFNCGSPDHVVSSCPQPRNSALIALSRQIYEFYKEDNVFSDRLHSVEQSRRQRLAWLDTFIPGQIVSELLSDAVYPGDGDWLKNIAIWGYPRGWSSSVDPRIAVRQRILNEWLDDGDLSVITDERDIDNSFDSQQIYNESDQSQADNELAERQVERWALYPTTEFSSALLPLYAGFALPSLPGDEVLPPPPPSSEPPPLPGTPPPPFIPFLDGDDDMDLSD